MDNLCKPKETSLKRYCAGEYAEGGIQDLGGGCILSTSSLCYSYSLKSMWKFGIEEWKVAYVDRKFSGTGGF